MIKYCSNFKCKLWKPIYHPVDEQGRLGHIGKDKTRVAIVGVCTCCGSAAGDCLRCGGI